MRRHSGQRPRCPVHLLVALSLWLASIGNCLEITDFVSTNVLSNGEVETRVHFKGVYAKETNVGKGSTSGLKFRQLVQGFHIIQLIYDDDDQLIDCEFGHDRDQTKSFLLSFKRDLSNLIATSNVSMESLDDRTIPEEFLWMNYTQLRTECNLKHRVIKKAMRERNRKLQTGRSSDRTKRSLLVLPGSLWCGDHNNAEKYTDLGNVLSRTDKCCRKHDFCKLDIPGLTSKYNYLNHRPFTLSHCGCDKRSKRDLFIVPGTNWCGKGYTAEKYTQLGGFSKTDRCCRKHDLRCPFWIGAFESKYGLFNWRMNTLMNCNCDERFRACLKKVRTSDANLVGKLFFNVVQTKCFVLKPKKKCVKYSWGGICEKSKIIKQAILRDNTPF